MPGPLTNPQYEAFARLRAGKKSNRDAAIEAGFSQKSASAIGSRLSKRDDISQRIAELQQQASQKVVNQVARAETASITHRLNRLATLQDLEDRIRQVILERAADPDLQNIPGGKSGMIFKQIKAMRSLNGGKQEMIYEYPFDAALAKELRAVGQQAAEERGQWKAKESEDDERPVSAIEYKWVDPKIKESHSPAKAEREDDKQFDVRVQ